MFHNGLIIKVLALGAAFWNIAQAGIIHQTTKWQSLGQETIADGERTNSNNGLFYKNSNGVWEQAVSGMEFALNQTVEFKVEIWKEYQGTHLSDLAKIWIDGDSVAGKTWELASNGYSKNYDSVWVRAGWNFNTWRWENAHWSYSTTPYYDGTVYNGSNTPGHPLKLGEITFSYTFDEAREYSLIARTMCSDDLSKLCTTDGGPSRRITYVRSDGQDDTKYAKVPTARDWAAFTTENPDSTLQGEIEYYTFHVDDYNVPEPGLLSLLGFGLLGLFAVRRKVKVKF